MTADDYPGGLDVITRILMRGNRRSQLEKEMCVTGRQSSKRCDRETRTEQPPGTRQGKEQVLPESLPKEHGPVSTCTAAQCKGLWTSELSKCEMVNLCHCKPLTYFIPQPQETNTNSPVLERGRARARQGWKILLTSEIIRLW